MKKCLFTPLAILLSCVAFSQNMPQTDGIKLDTKENYRAVDTVALHAATYLLSTPIDRNNMNRLKAIQFLMKWMEGTPDYTFSITGNPVSLFVKDLDMMSVYMASLVSYAIQNKSVKDDHTIILNATKTLIVYLDNKSNNVNMTGKLWKLSDAEKKRELESYLKQ